MSFSDGGGGGIWLGGAIRWMLRELELLPLLLSDLRLEEDPCCFGDSCVGPGAGGGAAAAAPGIPGCTILERNIKDGGVIFCGGSG